MNVDAAIEDIQFCYPQVYFACHTRHTRRRSSKVHLSSRDSEILVHLDCASPMTVGALARHLDLATSTLSEAITRLEQHGYVSKALGTSGDRRRKGLLLTAKGVAAVRASSVLDGSRLEGILSRLSAADRSRISAGLRLLAAACRHPIARKLR